MPNKEGTTLIADVAKALAQGLAALDELNAYRSYGVDGVTIATEIRQQVRELWRISRIYPGDGGEPYPIAVETGGQVALLRLLSLDPIRPRVITDPSVIRRDMETLLRNLTVLEGGAKYAILI